MPQTTPSILVEESVQPTVVGGSATKLVYLTFDDGPNPIYTPQILAVLARYGVRATFFVVGGRVEQHPDIVRAAATAGHAIGNHTFTHPRLEDATKERFDQEIRETDRAMRQALGDAGAPAAIMRPPYGSINDQTEELARAHGLRMVLWNVDPNDWAAPGAETISQIVLSDMRPGAVVLMHDGGGDRSGTVSALSTFIPRLLDDGYSFATVTE
jgi:peptidoglycan-N-acetylglucosamine deacetylase